MNIPIRMIGIATMFFWVFLIVFLVTAVYSVKDINFDFGEPQIGVTAENEVIFSLPISITNKGLYNIGSFNITTEISDKEGFAITRGSTFTPIIGRSATVTVTHNMTIDVNDLSQRNSNFLFNDTELRIFEMVSMSLAEAIPIQASTNFSVPWGAPLYNFTLGEIEYIAYNSTHMSVAIPISFENHAFFDLFGNIQIQMYNSADVLVGEGQTNIEAYQHSPCNGLFEFYVSIMEITANGHFEVYFTTPFFSYGPWVIPYG